jgi:outer membrane protein assembly factor BamE (lipoprotein component of BamABCDE complex)
MVHDLVATVLKKGVHRDQVVNLLGPPDADGFEPNNSFQYFLGEDSGHFKLLPTDYYLWIIFDSSGNVETSNVQAAK